MTQLSQPTVAGRAAEWRPERQVYQVSERHKGECEDGAANHPLSIRLNATVANGNEGHSDTEPPGRGKPGQGDIEIMGLGIRGEEKGCAPRQSDAGEIQMARDLVQRQVPPAKSGPQLEGPGHRRCQAWSSRVQAGSCH